MGCYRTALLQGHVQALMAMRADLTAPDRNKALCRPTAVCVQPAASVGSEAAGCTHTAVDSDSGIWLLT